DCKGDKDVSKGYWVYSRKGSSKQWNNSNNNKPANEKATQAYELFSQGKKPIEVAIQLNLSEKEAMRYYTEYWRLKGIYGLYHIYQESKGDLSYILKLCRIAKRQGITADNIDYCSDDALKIHWTSYIYKTH
ncbi:MAG: hypothetical protein WCF03_07960, partial [Nitrososphaeraceae archaeon]